jgi:phosphomannomutase
MEKNLVLWQEWATTWASLGDILGPYAEADRNELKEMMGSPQQLNKVFSKRIEFGTAGLRGRMGVGIACMNDITVLQTSQGLCAYLEEKEDTLKGKEHGIVIGYDGRYRSLQFAQIVAAVFLYRGFRVYLYSRMCPTPFVPYAILFHHAVAGVMITASHNPKQDNGYKLYCMKTELFILNLDVLHLF